MTRQIDIKALISHIVRGDGDDKCRICMGDTSEGQVYLGDTVMMDGERAVTLSELLEVITGVEVHVTTLLPNSICQKCTAILRRALPFLRLCNDSHKKWHEITDFLTNCKIPERTKNLYIILEDDSIRTVIDTNKCSVLPAESRQEVLKNFKTRLNRLGAYKKRNFKQRLAVKNKETGYICPKCDSGFATYDVFNRHIRDLGLKCCARCKEIFRKDNLKKHLLIRHNIESHSCRICKDTFETKTGLEKHINLNHSKGSEFCIQCNRSFPNYTCLAAHSHVHTLQMCAGCNQRFNKPCFRKHRCVNPTLKQEHYICDYCALVYTSKHALKGHIVTQHLKGKQHQCDTCGKKFLSRPALYEHENTHNRVDDRYICLICDSRYSSRRGFEKHLKKHQDS